MSYWFRELIFNYMCYNIIPIIVSTCVFSRKLTPEIRNQLIVVIPSNIYCLNNNILYDIYDKHTKFFNNFATFIITHNMFTKCSNIMIIDKSCISENIYNTRLSFILNFYIFFKNFYIFLKTF